MSKVNTARLSPLAYTSLFIAISLVSTSSHAAHQIKSKKPSQQVIVSEPAQPIVLNQTQQMEACAKVSDNVLRLACYDKININQDVVVVDEKKAPLDIAKTVTASIEAKKAVPVLANQPVNNATEMKKGNTNSTELTVADKKSDKEILETVGVTDKDVQSYSPLSVLYDLDRNDPKGVFNIRPHLPMYALPLWYSTSPNQHPTTPSHEAPSDYPDMQHLDSKVQISLKTKVLQDVFDSNADVWFGYTQQFYWQIYNSHDSRPFRSSDYQPELFITQPVTANLPYGGKLRMLGAGFMHESNGENDPLSRSWNRIYVNGGMEWNKLTVVPRLWYALPGSKKDDNKDINDYLGYGDVRWQYNLGNRQTVGGLLRYNPFENNGAVQIDYARPIRGGMKAYMQLFHGYGENIQDYNHKSTNIGIGLMFNDFEGL